MTRVGGNFFFFFYAVHTGNRQEETDTKKRCNYCFKESCWKWRKMIVG